MSERVAIVAGAGELGRATVLKLATAGFTVAGIDRNQEGLKELPDGILREAADPADPAAARSAVDRIAAAAGPPAGMATAAVSKAALVYLTRVLDLLAHATAPETIAAIIAYLVSDDAAPVSGAIVPAYGA